LRAYSMLLDVKICPPSLQSLLLCVANAGVRICDLLLSLSLSLSLLLSRVSGLQSLGFSSFPLDEVQLSQPVIDLVFLYQPVISHRDTKKHK
jgi:hypothetical protein